MGLMRKVGTRHRLQSLGFRVWKGRCALAGSYGLCSNDMCEVTSTILRDLTHLYCFCILTVPVEVPFETCPAPGLFPDGIYVIFSIQPIQAVRSVIFLIAMWLCLWLSDSPSPTLHNIFFDLHTRLGRSSSAYMCYLFPMLLL